MLVLTTNIKNCVIRFAVHEFPLSWIVYVFFLKKSLPILQGNGNILKISEILISHRFHNLNAHFCFRNAKSAPLTFALSKPLKLPTLEKLMLLWNFVCILFYLIFYLITMYK